MRENCKYHRRRWKKCLRRILIKVPWHFQSLAVITFLSASSLRDDYLYQIWWIFGKLPKRGGGSSWIDWVSNCNWLFWQEYEKKCLMKSESVSKDVKPFGGILQLLKDSLHSFFTIVSFGSFDHWCGYIFCIKNVWNGLKFCFFESQNTIYSENKFKWEFFTTKQ